MASTASRSARRHRLALQRRSGSNCSCALMTSAPWPAPPAARSAVVSATLSRRYSGSASGGVDRLATLPGRARQARQRARRGPAAVRCTVAGRRRQACAEGFECRAGDAPRRVRCATPARVRRASTARAPATPATARRRGGRRRRRPRPCARPSPPRPRSTRRAATRVLGDQRQAVDGQHRAGRRRRPGPAPPSRPCAGR